jgi:hypothetical protein
MLTSLARWTGPAPGQRDDPGDIRVAVEHLRARCNHDLGAITLFSDGTTVYECGSAAEIVDLLRGGRGVFGIALGATMREITTTLGAFPSEPAPVLLLSAAPHHPDRMSIDRARDYESGATA